VTGAYVVLMEKGFFSSRGTGVTQKWGLNDVKIAIVNVENPVESDMGADVHVNVNPVGGNMVNTSFLAAKIHDTECQMLEHTFSTHNTSTKVATAGTSDTPSNKRGDGLVNVSKSDKSNGKSVMFPVIEKYVKNGWSRFGLVSTMMNSKGILFFKFSSSTGMESLLENGPGLIHNVPLILRKAPPSELASLEGGMADVNVRNSKDVKMRIAKMRTTWKRMITKERVSWHRKVPRIQALQRVEVEWGGRSYMNVNIDDPNITIEEYIRFEEEKARKRGKVFNWETAKYGRIWYDEDVHDLRSIETEFPAIVFNDNLTSNETPSCEPTVSSLNDEINFRISFDEFDDEDYTVVFDKNSFSYKIISAIDLKTDSKNDNEKVNMPLFHSPEPSVSYLSTEPTLCPRHINEFNLKDETSLSECDEKEQNDVYFNDLFPFNIIYPDDSKSDKDNDDDKIDIEHCSVDSSIEPLPNVIKIDAQWSNKLFETSHDTSDLAETMIWKRIFKKRTKNKASKNGQNRARNGKDKVKSKPKSVKVKSQPNTVFGFPPYPFNYPTRRLTIEEMLNKFIDEGRCEQDEIEIFIKEFRTTKELLLKEQSYLLSELKIEVNELSKVMSNVLILKNKVKGVTTKGGKMTSKATRSKEINETGINKNKPPRFEQDVQEKLNDDGVENKPSSISERTTQPLVKPQHSCIPFPNRVKKEKEEALQQKFLENMKQLDINIPFIEALMQIPKYAKYLKNLVTNKSKLEEACTETMNERCLLVFLNELPLKEKDLGSFTIPCQVLEKHKKTEDLVADHSSRLENPHMEVLTKREIVDEFFDKHLMADRSEFTP
ncbi:hypothetical protein Tco_0591923, partial [Tanacetum coccineum]